MPQAQPPLDYIPSISNPFTNHEWAAVCWYNNLTIAQCDFLRTYYNYPLSASIPIIVTAYDNRDETHNHRDWPAAVLRTI